MSKNQRNVSLVLVVLMLFALALPALAKDDLNRAQWCEGVTIRFFAGGAEAMPLLVSFIAARWQLSVIWAPMWNMFSPAGTAS